MKKLFAFITLGLLCSESAIITPNQIDGQNNFVHYGQNNRISGKDNQVIGHDNNIDGKGNAALGLKNQLRGEGNLVTGFGNSINGKGNLVAGQGNIVLGADATQEEKALLTQKMLNMFASRGLGGIIGPKNANPQASNNVVVTTREPQRSNENKNNEPPSEALKNAESGQKIQQDLPENSIKQNPLSNRNPQSSVRKQDNQKKQQNTRPENRSPGKSTQEGYVINADHSNFYYNIADNEQMMDEDLTFFEQPIQQVDQTPSLTLTPNHQNDQKDRQDKKSSSIFVSQPIGQHQEKSPDLAYSVQPKMYQTRKSGPQEIQEVSTPLQVQHIPAQVAQQTMPSGLDQNSIEAQEEINPIQQHVDNEGSNGFKFYVHDEQKSTQKPGQSSSQQVVSSRYHRTSTASISGISSLNSVDKGSPQQSETHKLQHSDAQNVTPLETSNLRQEQTNRPVQRQQSSQRQSQYSNGKGNIQVINSGSSVSRQTQSSKPVIISSSTVVLSQGQNSPATTSSSRPNIVSQPVQSVKLSSNSQVGTSSVNSWSSSSSQLSNRRYIRAVSQRAESTPVVSVSSSTVSSSLPSSGSKPKTANDIAASLISGGGNEVIILSGEQSVSSGTLDRNTKSVSSQVPVQYFKYY